MSEEILTLEFDENEPVRLDHFLTDELPDYSRSRLQSFIKDGRVRIDGEPAKKYGQMLVPGQMITVLIPEERASGLIPEGSFIRLPDMKPEHWYMLSLLTVMI